MDCQRNLLVSIRTRVTQRLTIPSPRGLPIPSLVQRLLDDFRDGTGVYQVDPLPFDEWLQRWQPGKQQAMRDALTRPPRWTKFAFTKAEFVKPGDPRNIVCSDATVLARLGPITSGLDHALKRHPAAIKGYDFPARAKKMSVLRQYKYFMVSDYSRFDKTISRETLAIEMEFYRQMCPAVHEHPWLAQILMRQMARTHATSWRGVKYTVPPMRGTGDANTALGNWLLNRLVFLVLMDSYPAITVFIEGDDAICGFNYPPDQFVKDFKKTAASFGYVSKAWYADDLEQVPFCGRYLTATGSPRTTPVLWGYLTKWHVSKRTVHTTAEAQALLRFKTMSYLAMEPSTPVVNAIAEYFLRVLPEATLPTPEYVQVLKDNHWGRRRRRPTTAERAIVAKTSGITIATQLAMESYFDSLTELQTEYPQFVPFVAPDIQSVEVCPLPPRSFDANPPRSCRVVQHDEGGKGAPPSAAARIPSRGNPNSGKICKHYPLRRRPHGRSGSG